MKLIVGLGNAGGRYDGTRHNVGMDVVRQLARRHRAAWTSHPPRYVAADWRSPHGLVRLLCPLTMMNASGDAVVDANTWEMSPADVLLVCDDVNLPLGQLRLRPEGSDGGHHGIASCLQALGTMAIPRLRLGVGRQPLPKDLTDFVLSPFEAEERPLIDEAMHRAIGGCELWVSETMPVAMNRINAPTKA